MRILRPEEQMPADFYSGDTRPWRRAAAKADYSWRRMGYPKPMDPRYPSLIFAMIAMVRWYYLNPSCFLGNLHENDAPQGLPPESDTIASRRGSPGR